MEKNSKRYELRTIVDQDTHNHISKKAGGNKLTVASYLRMKLNQLIKEGKI